MTRGASHWRQDCMTRTLARESTRAIGISRPITLHPRPFETGAPARDIHQAPHGGDSGEYCIENPQYHPHYASTQRKKQPSHAPGGGPQGDILLLLLHTLGRHLLRGWSDWQGFQRNASSREGERG